MRFLLLFLILGSTALAQPVDFVRDVRPIFEKHCYKCHSETEQESGFRLDVKESAFKGGDNHGPDIVPGRASESPLIRFITSKKEDEVMPPGGRLSPSETAILTRWVNEGASWPEGIDRVKLKNTRDHWSFKSIARNHSTTDAAIPVSIDTFIEATLAENGLSMSPETDRVQWLRRVSLDLLGLPPTPERVRDFLCDDRPDAFEKMVDTLLGSERYGERWAQHWLDLVRYADTHGFEVNTERPNAWPYRDYVIRAFNQNTPYNRFIHEQLVGDSYGEDAATGFLVTASVLLPGQIGKDEPSMRLARQDSLDEIVNNICQTFLGLSVGCARCHDHKFDPITSKDYYAMQAFVAGVEYADRKLRTTEDEKLELEAEALRKRIAEVGNHLSRFAPLARPGTKTRTTNAASNVETFSPIEARFVRFTIHDSNIHPELGWIEPCIDEFEIYTDESEPRNVAPPSFGTKVTASGSKESSHHQLAFINDGRYGNDRSWMSNSKGKGWILFELPEPIRISKIVWSRDRKERYVDRLATAFTLETGLTLDSLTTVSEVLPLRPAIRPQLNIDRIVPTKTTRLRFTIEATDGLEPCIDELEVLDCEGRNVALASGGTQVKTSGDTIAADRHAPEFIHDGLYGNTHSWLSDRMEQSWIEFEFPRVVEIERIQWSRDRNQILVDRNATKYRIEVEDGGNWKKVSDSSDRRPAAEGSTSDKHFTTRSLIGQDAIEVNQLLTEREKLENKLKQLEMGQLVFAGKFRKPDEIHLLKRGDPEQPMESVLPAVIAALDSLTVSQEISEPERRRILADWIASPSNPLTARVMVNRLWQGHFGSGLVQTPNDFGNNGIPPTHPELLDWLASEFIRSGWSIKHMHRLIVLSKTYRQRSQQISNFLSGLNGAKNPAAIDSDVRLLWRYPSRRLEAEAIRDSMLAVSGLLNLQMYGRGFDLYDKRGGLSGFLPVERLTPENQRRMIYAHKVRRETEAVFGAFDCPDAGQSAALRRMSTTPIQALNLFNSPFTLAVSEAFSRRILHEVGDSHQRQIERAFQLTFNRDPTPVERQEIEPIVREHGLVMLCRVLFNSNEFLFIP